MRTQCQCLVTFIATAAMMMPRRSTVATEWWLQTLSNLNRSVYHNDNRTLPFMCRSDYEEKIVAKTKGQKQVKKKKKRVPKGGSNAGARVDQAVAVLVPFTKTVRPSIPIDNTK